MDALICGAFTMSQEETPLYGELVIPFNAEDQPDFHEQAKKKAAELRSRIRQTAYYLAEKRGFEPGYELEDWLKAEIQVLRTLR